MGLLDPDPSLRMTADQAVNHPYFQERPLPQRLIYMPSAPDTNISGEFCLASTPYQLHLPSAHRRRDSSSEDEHRISRQRVNARKYIQQMSKM